uniref:Secreted protein n=1 Tax=Utricularia reniformis TaxID=192314 RepID=A0A1Y0AZN0_9LAMI|nr:hypothetical protein AEK19_MT0345 [Utricularia reniformis]YP_009382732.1 hypothetical protein AEK19_MT2299 [Utricularia reniformis]ART30617.1 hypothetical protein AEK19_MT0345 [Utricularia reniformis]ART32442.1 hypothetical protein AEK19_MT2299 [Utricularia reniformis]
MLYSVLVLALSTNTTTSSYRSRQGATSTELSCSPKLMEINYLNRVFPASGFVASRLAPLIPSIALGVESPTLDRSYMCFGYA